MPKSVEKSRTATKPARHATNLNGVDGASTLGMGDYIASLNSLADSTRLRLLRLVESHELSVADLCAIVQSPQSTVSRHLKQLIEQGWTKSRRKGTTNLYRMAKQDLDEAALALWHVTGQRMTSWPTVKQDDLRLEKLLSQRARDSEAFFAGTAGQWDQLREDLYGETPFLAALLPLLSRDMKIADLGCGTGLTLARLAPWLDELVGVDQSEPMLKAAKKRLQGRKHVELIQGKLEALPLPDAGIDCCIMMLVLTYLPDPVAALAEAARVLRPDGKLLVLDLMHHEDEHFQDRMEHIWPGFEANQLSKMMKNAGLIPGETIPLEGRASSGDNGGMLFLSLSYK